MSIASDGIFSHSYVSYDLANVVVKSVGISNTANKTISFIDFGNVAFKIMMMVKVQRHIHKKFSRKSVGNGNCPPYQFAVYRVETPEKSHHEQN